MVAGLGQYNAVGAARVHIGKDTDGATDGSVENGDAAVAAGAVRRERGSSEHAVMKRAEVGVEIVMMLVVAVFL